VDLSGVALLFSLLRHNLNSAKILDGFGTMASVGGASETDLPGGQQRRAVTASFRIRALS
jgi:hypothetical protein